MRRERWLVFLFLLPFLACVSTQFEPYSAAQHYPDAKIAYATRIFEGDLATIAKVGGRVIGKMKAEGSGSGVNNDDMIKRVGENAPDYGGTHFFLTDSSVDRYFTATGNAWTGYQGPFISHEDHEANFIILRVEPDRWKELPKALQPHRWLYE